MNYDALIFDVDGTLWDAREPVTVGWNLAVERWTGRPNVLTAQGLGQHFGKTMPDIVRSVLPEIPEEEIGAFSDLCFELENAYVMEHPGRLYPGVRETLTELAKRYPLYIVSNCQKGYIECLVYGAHLEGLFSGWLCWGETGKPKWATLRQLMAERNLQHPVYIGDTQGDADACEQAGIDMIAVSYGLGRAERPAAEIDRFEELLGLL